MAHLNLPESLCEDYSAAPNLSLRGDISVPYWIRALHYSETKERALHILSQNKEVRNNLAPLLWNSTGTICVLLQEIVSVYCLPSSQYLTGRISTRVSNAIALFQCLASHPETRLLFLKVAAVSLSFLNNKAKERPLECLRITSLGVIGALVKSEDPDAIHFLLWTEIFPYCLNSMEVGSDLSKQVATFIIRKSLLHEEGLRYCSTLADRFSSVANVLAQMTEKLVVEPSPRLLKQIVYCYHSLSRSPRACDGLICCLPTRFVDRDFISQLHGDFITMRYLRELLHNIMDRH